MKAKRMKIQKKINSELGYYDKLVNSGSLSNTIVTESVRNSQEENKETTMDNLPYISKTKSEGKKTFEKDITNNQQFRYKCRK